MSQYDPVADPFPYAAKPQDYARPAYASRFVCIGERCEDNCCSGWSVPIDRATYEKYRSTPAMAQHLGTLVVLNTDRQTLDDYARLPSAAHSECGFLNGEKLCSIQKDHGPKMLSTTCATYPRAVAETAGKVEIALNLSCPEAARTTLLDEDLLGGGPWKILDSARYDAVTKRRTLPLSKSPVVGKAARLGQRLGNFEPRLAVRELSLLLLSDRRYPLWQRLYLMGSLARRLQASFDISGKTSAAWCEAFPGKVSKLLQEAAISAARQTLRPVMDSIPFQPALQIPMLLEMLRIRFKEPPVPMRFLECVLDFQLGLGTATAESEQEILDAYSNSYRQYYLPLMDRHPHLMENYLTNWIFKNNYPFGKEKSPHRVAGAVRNAETEHLTLCVHAGLAQTLLIGMAARYKEDFNETHVVKLIQGLSKTMEHSHRAIEQIAEFVQSTELSDPHGIAVLVRTEDRVVDFSKLAIQTDDTPLLPYFGPSVSFLDGSGPVAESDGQEGIESLRLFA
jgi:lysine-N-methylase